MSGTSIPGQATAIPGLLIPADFAVGVTPPVRLFCLTDMWAADTLTTDVWLSSTTMTDVWASDTLATDVWMS